MFKKFDEKTNVSTIMQLKSSLQKAIRNKLCEYYPTLIPYMDQILPKKENFKIIKCQDHVEILISSTGEQLFFKHREGAWFPTLRFLHKYPFMLAHQQVDRGAIKFVLSGANIMIPGLLSAGGKLSDVPKDTIVAVMAEGKQHALAVGITTMSTEQIVKVARGVGIETVHFLDDGLWRMTPIK